MKKAAILTIMAALLGWGAGCATPKVAREAAATQQQVLEELRKLNANLADIASTLKSNQAPRSVVRSRNDFQSQGPDREALSKIALPENPTKEQVRAYVIDIATASIGQNSYSDSDPQVALLARVGEDNLDVLIEAADGNGMSDYHIMRAINRLATERSKDLVLKNLAMHKEMAGVVLRRGWAADARQTLLDGLQGEYVPCEWITALASLRDTNTYPAMLEFLEKGQNRSQTYDSIQHLPGIDLAPSVAAAWERARFGHRWEANGMAMIALRYGHTSALEALLRSLQLPSTQENSYETTRILDALWEHTETTGSPDELKAWYEANKTNLVFDAATKKFRKGPEARTAP